MDRMKLLLALTLAAALLMSFTVPGLAEAEEPDAAWTEGDFEFLEIIDLDDAVEEVDPFELSPDGEDEPAAEEEAPAPWTAVMPERFYQVIPGTDADSDALFERYLARAAGNEAAGANAGSALTGLNALIYDAFRQGIADVAAGRREDTRFEVSINSLTLKDLWTCEDLGVDAIADGGDISRAADRAFIDMDAVMDCLLADCADELYWFDRQVGYSYFLPAYTARYDEALGECVLSLDGGNGCVTLALPVTMDFATGEYRADAGFIQGALKDIVAEAE